jgi:hypothetical protein
VASIKDEHTIPRGTGLGVAGIVLSAVLLVGCFIEANTGIPGMPRFWYHNQPIWFLIGLTLLGGGAWLLAPRSPAVHRTKWRPTRTGVRFRELIVYSREVCPLCDDAIELLIAYQRWLPSIRIVDVDTDARLVEKYGQHVPVAVFDGKVRFRGRIAPELLQRLIEGTPPL